MINDAREDIDYEECEYCWSEATHERTIPGDGRYAYCEAHGRKSAILIRRDTDGSIIREEDEPVTAPFKEIR
jgi:hypothetical protein